LAMLTHCTQTLALVAAHERRVADDIAEHDRRQFTCRIWREGIGRTRHRSLPLDSIGPNKERPGYYSGVRHSAKIARGTTLGVGIAALRAAWRPVRSALQSRLRK